jgi:hypothetical protein
MGDVPADTLRLRGDAGIAFGVGGVTRLYFDPSGNIGVAKQNPSEKLDVLGNMKVSGTATGAQIVSTVSNGTAPLVVSSATQVPNLNASLIGGVGANPLATRIITYLAGCDTCSTLSDSDDQRTIYMNVLDTGLVTINSVTCFSDSGQPKINLQKDDGAPANILSSDLTCSSASSGASTSSFVSGENVLNPGDKIDFVMSNALFNGGSPKRVTIVIKATVSGL